MISPSILNSDLGKLADELQKVSNSDRIHVDVMDNHFVPNLSWGLPIVHAVRNHTNVPIDAHLMIENPDRWAPDYAEAGAEVVTFHVEAATAPVRLARELRRLGAKAGVAVRPMTPIEPILEFINEFDLVLVMTVEPGFGGQKFLPEVLDKVSKIRRVVDERQLTTEIQVDGGINRETIAEAAKAGADNFVVGAALYTSEDPYQEVDVLRRDARKYRRS